VGVEAGADVDGLVEDTHGMWDSSWLRSLGARRQDPSLRSG
jgi:hypothetical protein